MGLGPGNVSKGPQNGSPLKSTVATPPRVLSVEEDGRKIYPDGTLAKFFGEVRGPDKRNGETGSNPRPNGEFTREAQVKFLELCILRGPRHAENAYAVGVCPMTERNHRKKDPEYRAAYEAMQDIWKGRIEQELIRRALVGFDEPVFFSGRQCGTIRRFSDPCLIALMKRYDPKYREGAQVKIDAGPGSGVLVINGAAASPEEWRERFASSGGSEPGASDEDGGGDSPEQRGRPALPPPSDPVGDQA